MDKVHEQDNLRIFEQIAQVKVEWKIELAFSNDFVVLHIVCSSIGYPSVSKIKGGNPTDAVKGFLPILK